MSAQHTPGPSLKELAEAAEQFPFDTSPSDVPVAARLAFCNARPANLFLQLLRVAEGLALATNEGDDASQGTHYTDKLGRIRCKGSFLALIEDARAAIAKATGAAS